MELEIGQKAPDFEALLQDGNAVRLADYKGKKVVLYFYPKDNTPTCTVEACNLRDNYASFQQKGYEILGVSSDSIKKHQNFIKKYELPFPLISDEDLKVHELYGTWAEKQMFGNKYMGTLRYTFVIDETGIIENIIKKVKSKDHANQILN